MQYAQIHQKNDKWTVAGNDLSKTTIAWNGLKGSLPKYTWRLLLIMACNFVTLYHMIYTHYLEINLLMNINDSKMQTQDKCQKLKIWYLLVSCELNPCHVCQQPEADTWTAIRSYAACRYLCQVSECNGLPHDHNWHQLPNWPNAKTGAVPENFILQILQSFLPSSNASNQMVLGLFKVRSFFTYHNTQELCLQTCKEQTTLVKATSTSSLSFKWHIQLNITFYSSKWKIKVVVPSHTTKNWIVHI